MSDQLSFGDLFDREQKRADQDKTSRRSEPVAGKRGRSFAAKRSAELNRHGDDVAAGEQCTWKRCPVHTS